MELSDLKNHDLRSSLYWALAGGKLRQALGCLPTEGVNKRYPVSDSGQGSVANTLIIGAISPENITPEKGELSLTTLTSGISVVRLSFAQPVNKIELRDLTISGRPKTYTPESPITGLAFGYTNWRTGLFGIDPENNISEAFDRTLTGAFASLALSRAMGLR
ncbi:MAG TPA: hypothetical protein PKA29_01195 [Candidatus Saccharibacteria bacterium]|jgi:hypothetical protein|nr:hypothetical protein [Candidatus Saccharibacteria bacterium]